MPHVHRFAARTVWTGAQHGPTVNYTSYSREFAFEVAGKPTLTGSAAGAFRGDESLPNPEDLLVAAVSACHLLSYLAECARAEIQVLDYADECTATMSFQDGKMRITEVTLRPRVTIAHGNDVDLAERLHEKAHEVCFIANSVNFPIDHFAEVTSADA
jgi:organic hydroperoxide reductase OsmC/OhrA